MKAEPKLLILIGSLLLLFSITQEKKAEGSYLKHRKDLPLYMEQKTDVDPLAPVWTYRSKPNLYNSVNAKVEFDYKDQVLYFLTYDVDSTKNKINDSAFYYSDSLGSLINEVEIIYNKQFISFTDIYVGRGIAVAYSELFNVISVTTTSGTSWNTMKFYYKIKKVAFHPNKPKKVAIITEFNYLYMYDDTTSRWKYLTYAVTDGKWDPQTSYFYYIQNYYTASLSVRQDLFRVTSNGIAGSRVIYGVDDFGMLEKIVWASFKDNNKLNLKISFDEGDFKPCIFPNYLNPKKLILHTARYSELFAVIVNATSGVSLYSGMVNELKFARIDDNIGQYKSEKSELCVDFESFASLPGVLIGQQFVDSSTDNRFTAISYSHGVRWGHIMAPRLIDGDKCEWPSCYLTLHLNCISTGTRRPITTVRGYPALMVAHGSIINPPNQPKSGIFISTDGGYSWIRGLKNIHSYTLLDQGGVILTYPEYSKESYYSYDFGLTWKLANVTTNDFRVIKIYHDTDAVSTVSSTIGYDATNKEWGFIKIDFTNALSKQCSASDYETFTPGPNKKSQCFQGKKNSYYKRKHNITCKSIIDQLPTLNPISCPCTADDFGCAYGYYVRDGDCVVDTDVIPNITNFCKFGDFVFKPSSKSKLIGDVCQSTTTYNDIVSDICGFTDNDNLTAVLVGNTIKFVTYTNDAPKIIKLPISLKAIDIITSFDVDYKRRCLFYVNGSGIIKSCWDTRESALDPIESLFVEDRTLKGTKMDEYTDNLYFFNKSSISVINILSRYRSTITLSYDEITLINIFPLSGIMAYVYKINQGSLTSYKVAISALCGEKSQGRLATFTLREEIKAIAYISSDRMFHIYTTQSYYKISFDGSQSSKQNIPYSDLVNVYTNQNQFYYVTKTLISYNKDEIIYQNHITDSSMHLTIDHAYSSPCSNAHCAYMCITAPSNSYQCWCPDTMVLDQDKQNCVCDPLNPNCKSCKSSEFHCTNQKCIDISGRCNGVDNCGDNSDEANCTLVCQVDEFSCDASTKCIDYIKRCDGIKDCDDGTDETSCEEKTKCKSEEFQCLNNKCIPRNKYCDGVNDCGDYSDEDSCQKTDCKYFEVKCDNGQCILPSQKCNGVMDCEDWSDEKGCGGSGSGSSDPNCTIKCDGHCITSQQLCNHITECMNGEDELNCYHDFECPIPGQLKCEKDYSCYSQKDKCDGFTTCNDGTDEYNCPPVDLCPKPESFKCDFDNTCISQNNYCDGTPRCDDQADESADCLNKPIVRSISITGRGQGFVDISWTTTKEGKTPSYNVTLLRMTNGVATTYTSTSSSFRLSNLIECEYYTVYVKFTGNKYGRELQFVAKPSTHSTPFTITYDYSSSILKWESVASPCLPKIYYILCESSSRKYSNFSTSPSHKIPSDLQLSCKVATCLTNTFNISCSSFSSAVTLGSFASSQQFVKIGLPIMATFIILAVIGFVCYKMYKSGKLRGFKNIFTKRAGFSKIDNSKITAESSGLFDEINEDADI